MKLSLLLNIIPHKLEPSLEYIWNYTNIASAIRDNNTISRSSNHGLYGPQFI